jgi:Putative restriction endonuclease
MVALRSVKSNIVKKRTLKIPDNLIWEVLDGKPLYRKGYKDVLRKLKTFEEIMGTSSWQSLLCGALVRFLNRQLDDSYDVLINELGIHFEKGDNVSSDICIVPRLTAEQITKKYATFAPKIIIEVDLDIDTEEMNDVEYIHKKTQKLLDFGVEKVIWILTFSKKVMVATPENDWILSNWNRDIDILNGITFNIENYLEERGINADNL